jgi:hypothetical protein
VFGTHRDGITAGSFPIVCLNYMCVRHDEAGVTCIDKGNRRVVYVDRSIAAISIQE